MLSLFVLLWFCCPFWPLSPPLSRRYRCLRVFLVFLYVVVLLSNRPSVRPAWFWSGFWCWWYYASCLEVTRGFSCVVVFFYMVMISMTGQKRQPTTWWCRLKKTHLCVCVHPSVGHITRCRTTSSWQRLVVIMMELHIMMNMKRRRTTTTCCHKFKIMPRCNWVGRRCSTSLLSTSEIIMMLWNNEHIDRRTDEQTSSHQTDICWHWECVLCSFLECLL